MAQNICDNHQYYQTFHCLKLLEEYVERNKKQIQMQVHEKSLKELVVFEETTVNSCDFKFLPSITMTGVEAIRHDFAECKYNAKVNWQTDKKIMSNKHDEQDVQYLVEYRSAEDETDNEDEKKHEDTTFCWKSIPLRHMKTFSGNRFSADVEDYFVFDTTYTVRITAKIKSVLLFNIQSNPKTIIMEQKPIPLSIHSWNSAAQGSDDFPPQNLLNGHSFYIADGEKDAWVIFDTNETDVHYIPTKVTVKGVDAGSMRDFNVCIGNAKQDKWVKCNETQLTMLNHDDYQSFELNYIRSQNSDTLKEIKSNHYTQYKLKMLNNYGGGAIFLSDFKLF
eukprot:195906_1